ncbi:hypothetical protein [Roseomonas chloroacetimidivorans]|uniref:hypothetical protein n=1 Tax=Roseomonas chloroacetimidivorans TaxID=1766656 RepID=UPI003C740339
MSEQDEVATKFRQELLGAVRNLRNLSFAAEYMGNLETSALLRCIGDLLDEQASGKLSAEALPETSGGATNRPVDTAFPGIPA